MFFRYICLGVSSPPANGLGLGFDVVVSRGGLSIFLLGASNEGAFFCKGAIGESGEGLNGSPLGLVRVYRMIPFLKQYFRTWSGRAFSGSWSQVFR